MPMMIYGSLQADSVGTKLAISIGMEHLLL